MAIISQEQISAYIVYDGITFKNDQSYQEASNLQDERDLDYATSTKAREIFIKIAENYMEAAENEAYPQHKAFLYAHARKILTTHLQYDRKMRELKEEAIFKEAITCAHVARAITDCSLQVSWARKSAYLLDPNPTELPIHENSNEAIKKYVLAADSWEMVGDIFLIHKKKVSFSCANFSTDCSRNLNYKYIAAKFYQLAAFSIKNANFIKQFNEKTYEWNDLLDRKIQLLDKSISTLEDLGLKINDFVFNVDFFEMLAGLYQCKINTYKREVPDLANLKSKVFEFRMKSAELCEKILQRDPNWGYFYYRKASNLQEAALHVKTVGEAAKLLKEAANAATTFRVKGNLPCSYITGGENDIARDALSILDACSKMTTLLAERGPDYPNPY